MNPKEKILQTAIEIAVDTRFRLITRDEVAELADCATGKVNYHFGTVTNLKTLVMEYAVENEILKIIAEGLVDRHEVAEAAPQELKERALKQYWI